ncbi:type 1 glutamine amidotransferase, partial [Brachyspira hampsonii]|nr:type 1 glutamine amidotransferase [Brachyspira hampsonii]
MQRYNRLFLKKFSFLILYFLFDLYKDN